jgi:hypothetical protein
VLYSLHVGDLIHNIKILVKEKIPLRVIARNVGLSWRQLKYVMKKHNIRARLFHTISDEELDLLSTEILKLHPTIGKCNIINSFKD